MTGRLDLGIYNSAIDKETDKGRDTVYKNKTR